MSTTVPADTVFKATTSTFPGWNNPDPSAYAWTLPSTSNWLDWSKNISEGVFSFVANTLLELIAWVLHLAIYVCSTLSDPSSITDPIVKQASTVFQGAYNTVFMKFLPVLVMMFVAYLAWKYVVAHHAKMLTGIVSTLAATALVSLFFFDFGPTFNTIDSFGRLVTNTAASAVASAAGTDVGSEYDTLWQNYVLFPWEYGQFGQFSGTLSEFNVSSAVCSDSNVTCSFTNDAGKTETISGNWVTLFLQNTTSDARTSLENALTQAAKDGHDPFTSSSLTAQAVNDANPYAMIPFLVIELLLILVPVIFLVYVGFQLFVRELLFIVTILMGMVTVPMAFIPEIGWRITANWVREAVGHQVERIGNAVYAALLFLVCSLVTQTAPQGEYGMMGAFLVDALLFAAALIYKQKVFSMAVNPLSDSVRGVDQNHRMTMDEYIAQQHKKEQRDGKRGTHGEAGHMLGNLAEHFASELHNEEHHVSAASTRNLGDALHVKPEDEQKPVAGHLASHFKKNNVQSKKPGKIVRYASQIGQMAKERVGQHFQDTMHPSRVKTHEERIREREERARQLERKLHGATIKVAGRTIRALTLRPKMADSATNPPDDNPPPGGGSQDTDYNMRRKMMIRSDGRGSQGVIFDRDGNKIAYDPPTIAPLQRDEVAAEVSQPTLAEGFNVPQDVQASEDQQSATPAKRVVEREQPGQAILATSFAPDAHNPVDTSEPDQELLGENPASDKGEKSAESKASTRPVEPLTLQNGIDTQSASENSLVAHSNASQPVSQRPSRSVQPRPLPSNVTRLEDEREHRAEVEGRQREQRSQRRQAQQGRRRVVRVNERSQRPPRPRGPEL